MSAPARDTEAYRWWVQGAENEADERNRRLNSDQRGARDVYELLCERDGDLVQALATTLTIYAAGLTRCQRIRLAWRVFR